MTSRHFSFLFVLFWASSALAQSSAVGGTDLSRGTTQLPGSAAWSDEATALIYNPAGLGRTGRFNAWYLHERSNARAQNNDGLWFATGIGDMVGLGVGFEWLRPDIGRERAKSTLGLSVGPQTLSLGAAVNWFHGGVVQALTSLDVGLQFRPWRWFSFGALARNVNTPHSDSTLLAREWTLGLGLRPFQERLTLGVDWAAAEGLTLNQSRLQYTVQAKIIDGFSVLAGVSHSFRVNDPLYVHAGLGVDLEHVGYTQGVATANGQVNWQFAARFSADAYPSVVPQKHIAVVSLADVSEGSGPSVGSLLGVSSEDRYLKFLRFLDRAAADPDLAGLVLKVEETKLGLARADEVRQAIATLRARGKKVFAYVLSASDAEYLMISGCNGIYAAPEAMFLVDGLQSGVTFFGGAAKRFGIDIEVARVGRWKNFPEQFTRPDMSEAQAETLNALLDTDVKVVAERIKAARGIDAAAWQAGLDEGLKPTRRAVELKQLDGVMTPQQFDEFLSKELSGAHVAAHYRPMGARDDRWGRPRAVAIIPVLGSISGGKNQPSPLTGDAVAGAQAFIESLNEAAEDESVAAIVIRVDSGGGDGLASALMYRAVLEAKKKKPVIASMGDVAASGGYYVAMGADIIVASPTTITGSIGVFYVKPVIQGLAEDFGVSHVSLARGQRTGLTDVYSPWTVAQREAAQAWVNDFYDGFITEVAASRKMPKTAVDAVAQGRVWSGEDALQRGLVDQLGGLMDAVALAKTKARVRGEVDLTIKQSTTSLLGAIVGATAPAALLEAPTPQLGPIPLGLQSLAEQLGASAWLIDHPRVQARLEYAVEIR